MPSGKLEAWGSVLGPIMALAIAIGAGLVAWGQVSMKLDGHVGSIERHARTTVSEVRAVEQEHSRIERKAEACCDAAAGNADHIQDTLDAIKDLREDEHELAREVSGLAADVRGLTREVRTRHNGGPP